jgi:hypothetical protein
VRRNERLSAGSAFPRRALESFQDFLDYSFTVSSASMRLEGRGGVGAGAARRPLLHQGEGEGREPEARRRCGEDQPEKEGEVALAPAVWMASLRSQ